MEVISLRDQDRSSLQQQQDDSLQRPAFDEILEPTRTLSIEVAYSVFEAGPFIKDTGPVNRVHFLGAETLFRF